MTAAPLADWQAANAALHDHILKLQHAVITYRAIASRAVAAASDIILSDALDYADVLHHDVLPEEDA